MKRRLPTRAALWPSRASGPSPLTVGEIHVCDATSKTYETCYADESTKFIEITNAKQKMNSKSKSHPSYMLILSGKQHKQIAFATMPNAEEDVLLEKL